jgi:hypothetical protein
MNPSSLITVLEAIGDQVDRLPDVSEYGTLDLEYDGEKVAVNPSRLSDEEIEAIQWGICGAITGVISLLRGEEKGNGVKKVAQNMFLAAVVGLAVAIDEDES